MIGKIAGRLDYRSTDHVLIDTGGVGYIVYCSERTLAAMPARSEDRLAAAMRARGVAKGDFVVVMLPRIPQWQVAMIACLKLGAVAIPCIEMLTERGIDFKVFEVVFVFD